MKVSILIILVILPMLTSIGLYCYAFISTRWNSIDNDFIFKSNLKNEQQGDIQINNNNTIQLKKRLIGYEIRSRYGLFGYCLEYKLLNLLTIKSSNESKSNSTLSSLSCNESFIPCPETNLCVCFNPNVFSEFPSFSFSGKKM